MGVIIKNMEMPESCSDCDFCIAIPDDSYFCDCPVIHGGLNITQAIEDDVRHPDCPLVEVPTSHGQLIDADELKKALDERFDEMRNMYPSIRFGPGWMLASSVIMHSPTVIEAEREEHEEKERKLL